MAESMSASLALMHEYILDHVFYDGEVVSFDDGVQLCAPRGANKLSADMFKVQTVKMADTTGSEFSFEVVDPTVPLPLRMRLPHCVPNEDVEQLAFFHINGETTTLVDG
eukprot:2515164-Pleurochrysis_carterae.AAC.1